MTQVDSFPAEVSQVLAAYVYRLVDPRTGDTFYVGKGRGDRAFAHAKLAVDSDESLRFDLIRRIRSIGLEPIVIIHRHGLTDESAFEVEAGLIDVYTNLQNEVGGHGGGRGSTTPSEIMLRYAAPPAEITVPAILIKIERQWRPDMTAGQLYESTRRWWVCQPERQPVPPRYAISIARGLIREVYEIIDWEDRPAEPPFEPGACELGLDQITRKAGKGRRGFIGRLAPGQLRQDLTLRSVRHIRFGQGNPIAYLNCR